MSKIFSKIGKKITIAGKKNRRKKQNRLSPTGKLYICFYMVNIM